jgi:signal transduction histidine kinase
MLRQTERLGKLAEQLLQLSKLEAGAVPLERRRLPVRTLLHDVADEWRTEAERRGVCFSIRVRPPTLALHADSDRMRQVLDNLVANAVRHSPAGGTIALSAAAHDGRVRVEVTDEGTGIPAAEAEHVFERFYRSDQARSSSEGGSGLGLAIVRWLVDLHGGTIRVEQAVPTGCRMIVELPR